MVRTESTGIDEGGTYRDGRYACEVFKDSGCEDTRRAETRHRRTGTRSGFDGPSEEIGEGCIEDEGEGLNVPPQGA